MTTPSAKKGGVLLTVPETAKRLQVSGAYVYRLIADGVLPVTDISRPGARRSKNRIAEDELAEFMRSRTSRRKPATVRSLSARRVPARRPQRNGRTGTSGAAATTHHCKE